MLAKKLALLVPLLALALPQTSGELGLVSRASRLSVYPPMPGLDPSPYYGLRVREVSKSLKSAGASKAQSFLRSDNHDHSHQPRRRSLAQIMVIIMIMITTEVKRILIK